MQSCWHCETPLLLPPPLLLLLLRVVLVTELVRVQVQVLGLALVACPLVATVRQRSMMSLMRASLHLCTSLRCTLTLWRLSLKLVRLRGQVCVAVCVMVLL